MISRQSSPASTTVRANSPACSAPSFGVREPCSRFLFQLHRHLDACIAAKSAKASKSASKAAALQKNLWPLLVFRLPYGFNHAGQLDDFDVARTVVPIVPPTHNYIATACRMTVVAEIAALEFKFDGDALPALRSDLPQCLAIRKSFLNVLHPVAQLLRQHPKQKHHALFVHGFMPQPPERTRVAVDGTASQSDVPCLARRGCGSSVAPWKLLLGLPHRTLRCALGKQRHHVCPLPLALCKIAKSLRHRRPAPKPFCQRAGIVLSQPKMDVPRRDRAVFSRRLAPVFQQRPALYLRIPRVRPESRRSHRLAPRSEVVQHKVCRDSGVRLKLRSRRRPAKLSRRRRDGMYDLPFVGHECPAEAKSSCSGGSLSPLSSCSGGSLDPFFGSAAAQLPLFLRAGSSMDEKNAQIFEGKL